ncbi:carboxylesterase family protein [Panacibacter ginsenosidivorans]|uniref:Carboxylic ester hydrolase n=1 Tax=Panacibacter ginsenosidivorans TaxID=1813871 RepID=A0A5B8V6W5_9BACT|nr:carboxylesterase family protein [Panacibacter ginsenosidivorans]QEC66865.1 carboxylesterase family protein [Panacibacter ginsenosidivorans]
MKKYFVSIIFLSAVTLQATAQENLDIVKTNAGFVSGTANADNSIHIFKGIPFATPPVGALRWKAPQPVAAWEGVKKCDAFSASPMQNKPTPFMMYTPEFLIPEQPISEDCLYLNVWTAAKSSKDKRPVIVWIYGGGFTSGGSACAIYDGENLAKKGVVFVSINYRVGVFGFLAHPELTKESNGKASGNFAFLDQIAALQWVKKNIAAFGGDPERVTIAGQSAGSFSVNALTASPVAKGLFQRAIGESGAMFNSDGRALTLHTAEENGNKFMQAVKASSIADMRKMSAEDLQKASASFSAGPVIDGYVLPTSVYNIFDASKQNDVPLLTGWNGDEGFAFGKDPSPDEYKANAGKQYGDLSAEFLKVFPGNTPAEIKKSAFNLGRDNLFAWQAYTWARMQSSKGKNKVYLYQFNHVSPGEEKWGAFHTSEVPYALHTLHTWNLQWTDADKQLEDIISSYWVNFATTGNPNGAGLPRWDSFDAGKDAIMVLDADEQKIKPISVKAEFDFIDKYQQKLRNTK